MSYLDQLKTEAQARQAQELEIQQQHAQQEEIFQTQVKPALEQLYHYLRELAQQLNYLKPETRVSYEIKGYGELDDFQQQNYRVMSYHELEALGYQSFDHLRNRNDRLVDLSSNFVLRCTCKVPYKIRIKKYSKREMELQKDFLVKHKIRFTCTEENDIDYKLKRAIFIVEPMIHVEFDFVGNMETSAIDLTVKNFTTLGNKTYTLEPADINAFFLDELAKYMTRQPNHLSLREKTRFSRRKNIRPSEQTPKNTNQKPLATETEPTSMTEDYEEFDKWLRTQQKQQLTANTNPPSTTTKKNRLFRFFQK